MEIEIITFGKITDFIPAGKISVSDISNTDQLKQFLERTYPQLAGMKYKLALNKALIQENVPVTDGAAIAIMPPFSGG